MGFSTGLCFTSLQTPFLEALRINVATNVVSGYTRSMNDNSDPAGFASFDIKGPDEDGHVWLYVNTPERQRGFNLGQPVGVVEKLSQWLASIEEREPL